MTQSIFDKEQRFREALAIMDDKTWIWDLVRGAFEEAGKEPLRLPSTVPIRHSWERFKNTERIIVHWEAKSRTGGAIIEEILDVAPRFDIGQRVIIVTTNPTHEDVVYFSELGLRRIVTLRNREQDRIKAARELLYHVSIDEERDRREGAWRKILQALEYLTTDANEEHVNKLEKSILTLARDLDNFSAREIDALGSIAAARSQSAEAVRLWNQALDKNPNYFRTYHNLIKHFRRQNQLDDAYALMKKMQELNKSNISRLVGLGEIKMALTDEERAEFYFKSALDRDSFCSGALNGLAEIRFRQGDLEESRRLLERSSLAYKTAAKLNSEGIELVRRKKYRDALEHYTRAQYVLPQQEKGPRLFYNIGLCYSRWGKLEMAREFLRIALVKQPDYHKAAKLLKAIEEKFDPVFIQEAS